MIGQIGVAISQNTPVPQPQSAQSPKAEAAVQASQPASQTPTSAEASKVVQAVPDSDNGRGADLQPQLNQQPQNPGTRGVNQEAVKILEEVQRRTSSDEFREELSAQLEAAGQDPDQPIVDIRL